MMRVDNVVNSSSDYGIQFWPKELINLRVASYWHALLPWKYLWQIIITPLNSIDKMVTTYSSISGYFMMMSAY